MKNLRNTVKRKMSAVPVALGAGLVGSAAYAADHSTEIEAAGADGVTNTGAAVAALITITAVVVGVGIVIAVLRKS